MSITFALCVAGVIGAPARVEGPFTASLAGAPLTAATVVGSWSPIIVAATGVVPKQPTLAFDDAGHCLYFDSVTSCPVTSTYSLGDDLINLFPIKSTDSPSAIQALRGGDSLQLQYRGLTYAKDAPVNIAGDWIIPTGDGRLRFTFTRSGKFDFQGMGVDSGGGYKLAGRVLTLTWESEDGWPTPTHFSRSFLVASDGQSFNVDTFCYHRPVEAGK